MVTLAAKGLAGREFVARRRAGCDPGLPDRPDEPYRFGLLGAVRQWIEAVFDTLQESAWAGTPRRPLAG